MSYISKYDTKFVTFLNRKYKSFKVHFDFFDDYALWIYYEIYNQNIYKYYKQLEEDIIEYSNFQTGKERDKRGKLNEWNNNNTKI